MGAESDRCAGGHRWAVLFGGLADYRCDRCGSEAAVCWTCEGLGLEVKEADCDPLPFYDPLPSYEPCPGCNGAGLIERAKVREG
jgi:hypothetical protein